MKRLSYKQFLLSIIICTFISHGFDAKASYISIEKNIVLDDTIKHFDKLLKQKWSIKLSNGQYGMPIVEKGIAFLPEEISFAVDIENGEKLFFKNSEHQKIFKSRGVDSLIYSYDDNESHLIDIYHGGDDRIYNNPFTWRYDIRELFVKDSIFIQIVDENLIEVYYLKNMWRRKFLWQKKIESRARGFIITNDSLAFLSDFEYFYILNKRTGEELWKKEAKAGIQSSQYIIDDLLYVITEIDEKTRELWCVDLKKLNLKWKYEFPFSGLNQSLYIDKNNLYFVGNEGIYCVDRINGKFKSLFKGNYITWYISGIKDYIIVYDKDVDKKLGYENEIITAIDKKTGKTTLQYFTSKGFPYIPSEFSKEEIEQMNRDGSWSEIRPINELDYALFSFVEVPNSNIVLAIYDAYLVAFEVIEGGGK